MSDIVRVGILCADALAKPVSALPEKGRLRLLDELNSQFCGYRACQTWLPGRR